MRSSSAVTRFSSNARSSFAVNVGLSSDKPYKVLRWRASSPAGTRASPAAIHRSPSAADEIALALPPGARVLEVALDEAHRVLVPGGRASIIDLRKEATMDEIREEVARMHMSKLSAAWTRLTFRSFLLKNAYSSDALRELVAKSRFQTGKIERDGVGFHLHLQRERLPSA